METCLAINCPGKRQKRASDTCRSLLVIGASGIGYCPKCRVFYRISKVFGLYRVKQIEKSDITFEFLPFVLE